MGKIIGYVERIVGETAYVRFTGEQGDVYEGECAASLLYEAGVPEGRRFVCNVVDGEIVIERISDLEVNLDELGRII